MANTGVMAVPPSAPLAAAPPLASVVTVWLDSALKDRLRATGSDAVVPCRAAPASASARVVLSMAVTATEAPKPNLSPVAPAAFGSADVVLEEALAALNDTSAPPEEITAP